MGARPRLPLQPTGRARPFRGHRPGRLRLAGFRLAGAALATIPPGGVAINFDGEGSRTVRDFFIHNALYWLEEYHFDGLRLDAVHAILDDSPKHLLKELAEAVHEGPGRDRRIHLVLENDANQARFLARQDGWPRWYSAQWNDDLHHACHVLLTGEADGYYADYLAEPTFSLPSHQPQGGEGCLRHLPWRGSATAIPCAPLSGPLPHRRLRLAGGTFC